MSTLAPVTSGQATALVQSVAPQAKPIVSAPTTSPVAPATPTAVKAAEEMDAPALQAELDRTLADNRTSLHFRVDQDVQKLVVTVLDAAGETIIQVPSEAALKIARAIADNGSGLIDRKV